MRDDFNVFRAYFAGQSDYAETAAETGATASGEEPPISIRQAEIAPPTELSEEGTGPAQFETEFAEFASLLAEPVMPHLTVAEIEALGAKICAFASRMASATCIWLMMIAEFDRQEGWTGTNSCAHWLSWACSMSPGTAREHVRVARAMTKMPVMSEEFGRGRLSYSKVRELTRIESMVPERELVELARTATASQLAKSVRGFRRHHPDRLRQELRRRTRWYTDDDGSVVLQARLPAEEGALLIAALEAAHDLLERVEDERLRAPVVASPGRNTVTQSDALLHLATLQLDASPAEISGADRHLVVVHVDSQLLSGSNPDTTVHSPDLTSAPAQGACQIQGVGGISVDTAARLACDAVVTTMVRSAGGAVLSHGRKHRLVQAAQRRALMVRDGQCRHPACHRTTYLQAHHVIHWSRGGKTDLDNLILLCRFHHMACHEGGLVLSAGPRSLPGLPHWEFRLPDGSLLGGSIDQLGSVGCGDEELLWNGIDDITSWDDREALKIRPLWAGERFSLQHVLAHLYSHRPAGSTAEETETAA